MHFLIVGATGRTGQAVIKESLEHGHTVTALVRDPSKVQAQAGVTLARGSPLSQEDVSAAFDAATGQVVDVVMVTLNAKRESKAPWSKSLSPVDLMEKSVGHVATAMKKNGVRRLIVLSAFGVGDSAENTPCYLKGVLSAAGLGPHFADHNAAHRLVRYDDAIEWIFFRPARLTEQGKMPVKYYGDLGQGISGMASISIASVADVMVSAATGSNWRTTPVISN